MIEFGLDKYPRDRIYGLKVLKFDVKVSESSQYLNPLMISSGSSYIPRRTEVSFTLKLGNEPVGDIFDMESSNHKKFDVIIKDAIYKFEDPAIRCYEYTLSRNGRCELMVKLIPQELDIIPIKKVKFKDNKYARVLLPDYCEIELCLKECEIGKKVEDLTMREFRNLMVANRI